MRILNDMIFQPAVSIFLNCLVAFLQKYLPHAFKVDWSQCIKLGSQADVPGRKSKC